MIISAHTQLGCRVLWLDPLASFIDSRTGPQVLTTGVQSLAGWVRGGYPLSCRCYLDTRFFPVMWLVLQNSINRCICVFGNQSWHLIWGIVAACVVGFQSNPLYSKFVSFVRGRSILVLWQDAIALRAVACGCTGPATDRWWSEYETVATVIKRTPSSQEWCWRPMRRWMRTKTKVRNEWDLSWT